MKSKRTVLGFLILIVLLVLFIILNMKTGSVAITGGEVLDALLGRESEATSYHIIRDIRIPRLTAALILGGALAVSGYLFQTFFHNQIAGPYVLGVSSAAKLVVAFVLIISLERSAHLSSWGMILAAFFGSMLSMLFILFIASRVKSMSILIICGVMIGYICSAVTDIAVTFADDSNIVNLHSWSLGSFSGITQENNLVAFIVTAAAMLCTLLLSKPIGAYQLGETYAENLGVNIRGFRISLVLLSGLLSACVTAFAGPISFVGIAVPHLMRNGFKTEKPLIMIPACFLGGSVFCLLCDLIARSLFAPVELSISTVTSVFGAPIVIWILFSRNREGRREAAE